MAELVYLLCACTSILCAVLLIRAYQRRRSKILLWSSVGFCGLAVNNIILFLDLVIYTQLNLSPLRNLTALVAMGSLLFGLIWDTL